MALARRFRCTIAILAYVSAPAVAAEMEPLQPDGTFAELFLESPKVSGNLLVGLRWAAAPGAFALQNVRLNVPIETGASKVCVDIASKDGRYTAENLYTIPKQASGLASFAASTKYADRLRAYPIDDVAVIIHAASSCDASDAKVVIPAVVAASMAHAGEPARSLVAYVNADAARTGLTLIGADDRQLATGECKGAIGGVQIAFSTACTIVVPASPPGPLRLRLSVKERFKTVPTDYTLLLP